MDDTSTKIINLKLNINIDLILAHKIQRKHQDFNIEIICHFHTMHQCKHIR